MTTRSGIAGVLVLTEPMIYLLSQALYFRIETGTGWFLRVLGAVLLGGIAATASWIAAYAVVTILVALLLALAMHLSKPSTDATVHHSPLTPPDGP